MQAEWLFFAFFKGFVIINTRVSEEKIFLDISLDRFVDLDEDRFALAC